MTTDQEHDWGRAPWARIEGAVWVGDASSVDEAIEIAGLGWEIQTDAPLYVSSLGRVVEVPRAKATIRLAPEHTALAAVGPTYTPIQNREALGLIEQLATKELLEYGWAGEMDGGRQVFLSTRSPSVLEISGDLIDLYYEVLTSHDESTAIRLTVYPVSRGSGIILSIPFSRATRKVAIKHTLNGFDRANRAAGAIPRFREYLSEFVAAAERLAAQPLAEGQLHRVVEGTFDFRGDRQADCIAGIQRLLDRSRAEGGPTLWSTYIAVVEWIDRYQPVRSGGVSPELEHRAMRMLYDANVTKAKDSAARSLLRGLG